MEKSDVAAVDMLRQKILMRRRIMSQRVKLSDGQSFLASFERVSKTNLPRNITITRTRQIGPRQQRKPKTQNSGSILGNIANLRARALTLNGLLKRGIDIGAKALNSALGKKLVDERIKHAPELYKFGTSKIKTET